MTLIERLRIHMKDYSAAVEAADRIEQLEAENINLRQWKALNKPITAAMSIANSHLAPLHARIEQLEAALREAITVFESWRDDETEVELLPRLRAILASE